MDVDFVRAMDGCDSLLGFLIFISDEKCMWQWLGREGSWPLICCVIDGSCFILRD